MCWSSCDMATFSGTNLVFGYASSVRRVRGYNFKEALILLLLLCACSIALRYITTFDKLLSVFHHLSHSHYSTHTHRSSFNSSSIFASRKIHLNLIAIVVELVICVFIVHLFADVNGCHRNIAKKRFKFTCKSIINLTFSLYLSHHMRSYGLVIDLFKLIKGKICEITWRE